jgi:redox-sensitive bicupin YhaK (pirin superfamily)
MIPQVPGKIYLADQRGLLETSEFRRQSTFHFGTFQREHKEPFGRLYGIHEETLAGGHAIEFTVAEDSYIVLLPITGAVAYGAGDGTGGTVEAEEMVTLAVPAGTPLRLRNPFADELVSLLHLWVRAPAPLGAPAGLTSAFDAQALENRLCELVDAPAQRTLPHLPFSLSLGRFAGRHEAVYKVAPGNTLFAFVIAGAFELEGRLLHEKDGLALWNAAEIELEALSNHALLLVLELLP